VSREELLLLRIEVQDFLDSYGAAIDAGDWDKFLACFATDAEYQIISRENFDQGFPLATVRCESRKMLRDRVFGVEETMMYEPRFTRHIISGVRIDPSEDHLKAIANYCVFETIVDQETKILQVGRYDANLIQEESGFVFTKLHCIFDSVIVPNSLIYPI
tara:strand:- start:10011 stop:10490 length:480 start_codon:yes stop_codon:yes gene_type:complete